MFQCTKLNKKLNTEVESNIFIYGKVEQIITIWEAYWVSVFEKPFKDFLDILDDSLKSFFNSEISCILVFLGHALQKGQYCNCIVGTRTI